MFEEEEALERSSEDDAESFFDTCNQIRNNMAEIAKLKSSNDPNVRIYIFIVCIFNNYI
jgi:hypothetical protein